MTNTAEIAGRWLRVSTGGQDEANQAPDVDRYITEAGYIPGPSYIVHGKSAFHGRQDTDWKRALADMRAGRVNVLVAWVSDRVERRGIEALLSRQREAREAGGRLEFSNERHLNGAEDHAELMSALAGYAARQESARKAERIAAAHHTIRANGGVIGRAPFGYAITGPKYARVMVPDDREAGAIRECVRRYLDQGASLPQLCRWLDSEGIRPRSGVAWYPRTLSGVLRNPALMGRQVGAGGKTVHKIASPILNLATWKRLQNTLDAKATRKGRPATGSTALLTGIAKCGKCGAPMYRLRSPYGAAGDTCYYRCHPTHGRKSECRNMVPLAELDAWADAMMSAQPGYVISRTVTPAEGWHDEIQECERDLTELSWDAPDFLERQAALLALRKDLMSRPSKPAEVKEEVMPYTVGNLWDSLDVAGKRDYLRACGLTIDVIKGFEPVVNGDPSRAAILDGLTGRQADTGRGPRRIAA